PSRPGLHRAPSFPNDPPERLHPAAPACKRGRGKAFHGFARMTRICTDQANALERRAALIRSSPADSQQEYLGPISVVRVDPWLKKLQLYPCKSASSA